MPHPWRRRSAAAAAGAAAVTAVTAAGPALTQILALCTPVEHWLAVDGVQPNTPQNPGMVEASAAGTGRAGVLFLVTLPCGCAAAPFCPVTLWPSDTAALLRSCGAAGGLRRASRPANARSRSVVVTPRLASNGNSCGQRRPGGRQRRCSRGTGQGGGNAVGRHNPPPPPPLTRRNAPAQAFPALLRRPGRPAGLTPLRAHASAALVVTTTDADDALQRLGAGEHGVGRL